MECNVHFPLELITSLSIFMPNAFFISMHAIVAMWPLHLSRTWHGSTTVKFGTNPIEKSRYQCTRNVEEGFEEDKILDVRVAPCQLGCNTLINGHKIGLIV